MNSPEEFERHCATLEKHGLSPERTIPNYHLLKAAFAREGKGKLQPNAVSEVHREPNHRGTEYWLSKFITKDEAMLKMKDVVRKLAGISDPVLITGETGTGKELIAHALHGQRTGNFI